MSQQISETERAEGGFEFEGRFYRWSWTDHPKDLWLVDRISGMDAEGWQEAVQDENARRRYTVMLTLVATSIRAANPQWTPERVYDHVMNVESFSGAITVIEGGVEEKRDLPPTGGGEEILTSGSSVADSSPSSTPQESSTYEILSAIRA